VERCSKDVYNKLIKGGCPSTVGKHVHILFVQDAPLQFTHTSFRDSVSPLKS
jgi:hypothetical protein